MSNVLHLALGDNAAGCLTEACRSHGLAGWDERHYVPQHSPEELAALFGSAVELSDSERQSLADDFLRIRDETGLLRRWEAGRVIGVPLDHYDRQLLGCCTDEWTVAARVIGLAMSRCDVHNRMSDLFFASRLQHLIDAGKISTEGDLKSFRDYRICLNGAF